MSTNPRRSGTLIVLEGIDGAGTTTQARRLAQALVALGKDAHLTHEPSDLPIGRLLREMLMGQHAPTSATTMALLFAADRADHLSREVEPQLARGAIVISDRWYHSSLAYQGTEEDRVWIETLNARARKPHLTFLLDLPAEVAAARRAADGRPDELFDQLELQRRIAENYRAIAKRLAQRERIVVLDGMRPVDDLAADILALTRETCDAATGVET